MVMRFIADERLKTIILVLTGIGLVAGAVLWRNSFIPHKNNNAFETAAPDVLTNTGNKTKLALLLPEGVEISQFAESLVSPRVLTEDPNGVLLVSSINDGKVMALPDKNNDGTADTFKILAEKLVNPHGLAMRCPKPDNCQLYIAETHQVLMYDYDRDSIGISNPRKIIDLPNDGGHSSRTLLFLSPPNDDQLLISIGSSCDQCEETDKRRAAVYIANADGSNFRPYSIGLRNAVFMTTHPITQQEWATEMGLDDLGPDLPPDEVNILQSDKHFGWPYCYGKKLHDATFDPRELQANFCKFDSQASQIDIPAHSAPLGLAFIPAKGWRNEYQSDLIVAYHGSSHRDEVTGYKVVKIDLDQKGNALGIHDFITGWLASNKEVFGRPTAIHVHSKDHAMYITDDKAGVVYRVVDKRSNP